MLAQDRLARFNRIEGLINEAKAMYERTGVPSKSQFEQIGEDFSQARIADCEKEVAALKLEVVSHHRVSRS